MRELGWEVRFLMPLLGIGIFTWGWFCIFRPGSTKWNFRSPLSGNYYEDLHRIHGFLAMVMGVAILLFWLAAVFGGMEVH